MEVGKQRNELHVFRQRQSAKRRRRVLTVAGLLLVAAAASATAIVLTPVDDERRAATNTSSAEGNLGGSGIARAKVPFLEAQFRRTGPRDRLATLVEQDRELPALLDLLSGPQPGPRVLVELTLSDVLDPQAHAALDEPDEGRDCIDPASGHATQLFELLPLDTPTSASDVGDLGMIGSNSRPLVQAVLAQIRARRIDGTPAIGIAGGPRSPLLVFGASSSGVEVAMHIGLVDGRLLVGPIGHGVAIAKATDLRCWRAIARRHVDGRRDAKIHHFAAPLSLSRVRVVVLKS